MSALVVAVPDGVVKWVGLRGLLASYNIFDPTLFSLSKLRLKLLLRVLKQPVKRPLLSIYIHGRSYKIILRPVQSSIRKLSQFLR